MGIEPGIVGKQQKNIGFGQGVSLTLLLAIAAKYLALLPFLNIMASLFWQYCWESCTEHELGYLSNQGQGSAFQVSVC